MDWHYLAGQFFGWSSGVMFTFIWIVFIKYIIEKIKTHRLRKRRELMESYLIWQLGNEPFTEDGFDELDCNMDNAKRWKRWAKSK